MSAMRVRGLVIVRGRFDFIERQNQNYIFYEYYAILALMSFKIHNSGLFTTLQDQGRIGYTHLGITSSGAMDLYAYRWSQKLLHQNINALEVMVGLVLEAMAPIEISVTGADLGFEINGIPQGIWQTHHINAGDILSFKKRRSGQRAYLAVRGGFKSDRVYGSYATTFREGTGRHLRRGELLLYDAFDLGREVRRVQTKYIPRYGDHLILRLVLGYQEKFFSAEAKARFFNTTYHLTPQSNRMGYKLRGEAIEASIEGIVSEGIAYGAVQVPKDGQPIILLNERQTIGGYPKIGSILPIDCYALAQLPLNATVNFQPINLDEAQKIISLNLPCNQSLHKKISE